MLKAILKNERQLLVGLAALLFVYAIEITPLIGPVGHFGFMTDGVFLVLLAIIIYVATGVVQHAEALAKLFGEPYGTLILTMTAVLVEVVMLGTIMIHGPESADHSLARNTMYSTIMILLTGLMGLALFVGGKRFIEQQFNSDSAGSFMTTLLALTALGFYVPMVLPTSYIALYNIFLIINSIILYGYFLKSQTGRLSFYFSYRQSESEQSALIKTDPLADTEKTTHSGITYHVILLFATICAIAVLVEFFSIAIDDSMDNHGLPAQVGALFVAIIIITPEGMTAVRAALRDEMQRAINIVMGSALSTVALTIPAMLLVSQIAGFELDLALTPLQAILLFATMLVAFFNAYSGHTNELKGVIHFSLFAAFVLGLFM